MAPEDKRLALEVQVSGLGSARLSARNQLAGTVRACSRAPSTRTCASRWPAARWTTVTLDSALALAAGMPVCAVFKASSVIVGCWGRR